MRAGLLSDPRVVALLSTLFVPVHISALNTPGCMHDPRDVALLQSYVGENTDAFLGGEREAFVTPDGVMGKVFLSLNGCEMRGYEQICRQYTARERRAEAAVAMFRHYGSLALRSANPELPEAWGSLWQVDNPAVAAIAASLPKWPEPAPGRQGFRVFVRNSYRMYDDLHGSQLALQEDAMARNWLARLHATGDRAPLPASGFADLVQAMVPRGMVDTRLDLRSISGDFTLVAKHIDDQQVTGIVTGEYAMKPTKLSEVGKRPSAAAMFESTGRFVGRFRWNREAGIFDELLAVVTEVQFAWLPEHDPEHDHLPRHQVAIEWVRAAAPAK